MQSMPFGSITNEGLLAEVLRPNAVAVAEKLTPVNALWNVGNVASPFWNVVEVSPVKAGLHPVPQASKLPLTASVAVPVFTLTTLLCESSSATVTLCTFAPLDVNGVSVIGVDWSAEAG